MYEYKRFKGFFHDEGVQCIPEGVLGVDNKERRVPTMSTMEQKYPPTRLPEFGRL